MSKPIHIYSISRGYTRCVIWHGSRAFGTTRAGICTACAKERFGGLARSTTEGAIESFTIEHDGLEVVSISGIPNGYRSGEVVRKSDYDKVKVNLDGIANAHETAMTVIRELTTERLAAVQVELVEAATFARNRLLQDSGDQESITKLNTALANAKEVK